MTNSTMAQLVTLDLAGSGTLIDVTSNIKSSIVKTGTRQDQFRPAVAATVSFALENYDGRFTPGNTPIGFAPTTLAANVSAGASSFSSNGWIPSGSYVVVDTGAGAEVVQTGTPS